MSRQSTRWAHRVHNDGRGFCAIYTSPCGRFEISDELVQPSAHVGTWAPWTLATSTPLGFVTVLDDDGKGPRQFKTTEAAKRHASALVVPS